MASGWKITCGKCGKVSQAALWLEPVIPVELPPGGFQCPFCKVVIQRRSVGGRMVEIEGLGRRFIPARVELVEVG